MATALAESVEAGLAAGKPVVELEAVADAAPGPKVWRALLRDIADPDGNGLVYLEEEPGGASGT